MPQSLLLSSPIGTVEVCLDGHTILSVSPYTGRKLPSKEEAHILLQQALWSGEGVPAGYTVALPSITWAPHFWKTLADIPIGRTITYGELARRLGHPQHARPVGRALHTNPIPILLPCHRVVAARGEGGFALGLPAKRSLLEHEQRLLHDALTCKK